MQSNSIDIKEEADKFHPADSLLQADLISSIWCSGCGIGTVMNTFIKSIQKLGIEKISVVSGIGCPGKVAGYLKLDSHSITDGNAIGFASKLSSENPDRKVVVFVNDADFIASGADDFVQAGEKEANILVIYINNFVYRLIVEKKNVSITSFEKNDTGSPFNIPLMAESCGAVYVARWTPLHVRRLMYSMNDALQKPGFSVIEVISPCLMYYAADGKAGEVFDRMKFFRDNTIIEHGEPTENLDIRENEKIIVGRFVNKEENGETE